MTTKDFPLLDKIPSDSWNTLHDLFRIVSPPYCSATLTTRIRELVSNGYVKTSILVREGKAKGVDPVIYQRVNDGFEVKSNIRKCLLCRENFSPETKHLFRCIRCRNIDESGMDYCTGGRAIRHYGSLRE